MLSVLLRLRYGYDNYYQRWAKRNKSYVRRRIGMRWYVLLPLFSLIVVSPGCSVNRATRPQTTRKISGGKGLVVIAATTKNAIKLMSNRSGKKKKKNPFHRKRSTASAMKPSGPAIVSAACFMS